MSRKSERWFNPEMIIPRCFIGSTLYQGAPRLALIIEICRSATGLNITKKAAVERWEDTWFSDFVSTDLRIQPYQRGNKRFPHYFVNYACGAARCKQDHKFRSRTHLGSISEPPDRAFGRFATNMSQYGLLARPTAQGTHLITANKGSLAMAVSKISRGFDESLDGEISSDIEYRLKKRIIELPFLSRKNQNKFRISF